MAVSLVGLVFFAGVLASAINRDAEQQPAFVEDSAASSVIVNYDGESFTPKTIEVAAGTKVAFLNASSSERPLYIASDPHPTHENYPGLDAGAIGGGNPKPGDNQSFTFEKTGTWGCHDHNFPSATGTVKVN